MQSRYCSGNGHFWKRTKKPVYLSLTSIDGTQPTANFLAKLPPIKTLNRGLLAKSAPKMQKYRLSELNESASAINKPWRILCHERPLWWEGNYQLTASAPVIYAPKVHSGWWLIVCFVRCLGFCSTRMSGDIDMLLQMITTAKRAIKELESKSFSIFFVNSKTVSFSPIFSSFEVCSMCFGCTVQLALSKVCRGTSSSIRHLVAAPCHNDRLAPPTTTLPQPPSL